MQPILGIGLCILLELFTGQLWAKTPAKTPPKTEDKTDLKILFDKPSFRRLVMASPSFTTRGNISSEAQTFSKEGPVYFNQIMEFSGFFSAAKENLYIHLSAPKPGAKVEAFKAGVQDIALNDWKSLGVDLLTLAELAAEGQLTLSLKTIDINKGEVVTAKKYSGLGPQDYKKVMRRYGDAVLSAVTGKTGIFNSQIVFIGRKIKGAEKQVYTMDFDGSNITQITHEPAPHLSPEWSKDGRYITYTSYEDKNPDLMIYDTQSGKKRKLSARRGLNSGGTWTYDHKYIAFTGSQDGEAELYLVRPDGSGRRLLIKGNGLDVDPAFSPDNKSLAFVSGRFGNPHIFVANLVWEGGEPRVVSDKRLTYAGWYNAAPAWSPDGSRIAFGGYDKDIDRFDIFTMDANGQNMERLTLKSGDNESPSWSPNGQLIYYHSNRSLDGGYKGPAQIYIMNRDGSGQRRIPTGLFDAQTPNWSPQKDYNP